MIINRVSLIISNLKKKKNLEIAYFYKLLKTGIHGRCQRGVDDTY